MIVKTLGFLDILTALSLWIFHFFHITSDKFILLLAFYLLTKGIFFSITSVSIANLSVVSFLDIISASLIFITLSSPLPSFIIILVSLFLLQKGIFSLFA